MSKYNLIKITFIRLSPGNKALNLLGGAGAGRDGATPDGGAGAARAGLPPPDRPP